MQAITDEIDRALSAGLYYLAVALTLTLPDICAALESSDGEATKARYMSWCDTWFLHSYPQIRSLDLYSLRCGVVHQGRLGHPRSQYARIVFTLPDASGNVFHRGIIFDVLSLDAVWFCRDMIEAVTRWDAAKQGDSNVAANLPRLVRYHENGLPPFVVGIPLIG